MKIKELKSGTFASGIDVYVQDNAGLSYNDKKTGQAKTALKYVFADETGMIEFVDFDKAANEAKLQKNDVVTISGTISDYQGKMQIKLNAVGKSMKQLMDFQKKSKFNLEEMWDKFVARADQIKNPMIKKIAEELMLHEKTIKIAPAARGVHGDWVGGLMEHSLAMSDLAFFAVSHYKKYFPELNEDIIQFGCLFHDLGKIWEYDLSGVKIENSYSGHLVPHIITTCSAIKEAALHLEDRDGLEVNQKILDQLIHVIAAHHGQLDWGSPVVPKTMEAIVVHQLDLLDARMMAPYNIMEKGEGDFTEKLWTAGVPFVRQKIS